MCTTRLHTDSTYIQ